MTKISRGQRAHLLALYTPGAPCTLTLRNRVSSAAKQAVRSLKKLERSTRKAGGAFVEMSGAVYSYERMTMGMHHDVVMALLAGVYP